jgi:hypothetical protein
MTAPYAGTHVTYMNGTYMNGTYMNGTYMKGTYMNGTYMKGTYMGQEHWVGQMVVTIPCNGDCGQQWLQTNRNNSW